MSEGRTIRRRVRPADEAPREVRERPRYVVEVVPTAADPKAAEAVLDWLAALLR